MELTGQLSNLSLPLKALLVPTSYELGVS